MTTIIVTSTGVAKSNTPRIIAAVLATLALIAAVVLGTAGMASGSNEPTTAEGKAFVAQWEQDSLSAAEMGTSADGQMITFILEDGRTVTYNTTMGGGIWRSEVLEVTGEGKSGYALEDAEGARFEITGSELTVEAGTHGTFSLPREETQA